MDAAGLRGRAAAQMDGAGLRGRRAFGPARGAGRLSALPPSAGVEAVAATRAAQQQSAAQPLAVVAAAAKAPARAAKQVASTSAAPPPLAGLAAVPQPALAAAAAAAALALALGVKRIFDTPSRAYDNNVGTEYDAWTEEGARARGRARRPFAFLFICVLAGAAPAAAGAPCRQTRRPMRRCAGVAGRASIAHATPAASVPP